MSDQDMMNTEMDDEATKMSGEFQFPGELEKSEPEPAPDQPAPKVIIKKDGEFVREHVMMTFPVIIGRKTESDILFEEKNVSRRHAQIDKKDELYIIEDLGSAGGTKVNGEKMTEKDIHTGDIIEIGDYQLHFDSGLADDEKTVFEEDEATVLEDGTVVDEDRTMFYEEPEAKLVVSKSPSLEGEIILEDDETIFGRDEDADMAIDDKRLSRKHCKIFRQGNDFVIQDLGSSNGTFVNGTKITEKTLANGDSIQIGSTAMTFRMQVGAAPKSKPRLGTFIKGVLGLGALIILVLIGRSILNAPKSGDPHRVIMQALWEQSTKAAVGAALSVGDLNGDGYINLVAADKGGLVYGLDGRQGGMVWNAEYSTSGGAITAAPLLVDINEADNKLDVIIGTTTRGVHAIDGETKRLIWNGRVGSGVPSAMAASDVNADGTHDVFVGTISGTVVCLDGRQGGAVWTYDAGAPVKSAPVLSDLNDDKVVDVIIGTSGNKVHALDGKNGNAIWVHGGAEEFATVAVADFNKDKVIDVVAVSPSRVTILEGQKGAVLWTWMIPASGRPTQADPFLTGSPAICDLTGDKSPDIVLSTSGGHVYALAGEDKGAKYIWDYALTPARKSPPALCDMNNDGTPDVIVGDTQGNIIVINGESGHQLSKLNVGGRIEASPVIGDFSSTGVISIVVGSGARKVVAVQTETKIKKNRIAWGSYGGDYLNSGNYRK